MYEKKLFKINISKKKMKYTEIEKRRWYAVHNGDLS